MRNIKVAFLSASLLLSSVTLSASSLPKDDYLDNATVTAAIKLKQVKDKLLSPTKVKVVTDNHRTQLIGSVESETQFKRLLKIAAETEGVEKIDISNLLVVKEVNPDIDKSIQSWARLRLDQYNNLNPKHNVGRKSLNLEVRNANIYVTGYVPSIQQKKDVFRILSSVPSANKIVSDISIQSL